MPDLFDLGENPIKPKFAKNPAGGPPALIAPKAAHVPTEPPKRAPAPVQPDQQPGLVASFACYCGCQSEVREPAPEAIPCWECKRPMHRWTPRIEPPIVSAEVWDGENLVRGR